MQIIYLFIMKSYSKYSDKKEKTRNVLVNAKIPTGHAGRPLYFTLAIAATVESSVTGIVMDVLIHFSVTTQHSKGAHSFHRVVGLVVNIHQWRYTFF